MRTPRSLLALLTAALPLGIAHGVVYDFESLSNGDLNPQDNWVLANGLALQVQTGLGVNNTKTLYSPVTGTPNVAHRINDGNFSFGTITGTETALILQGDFRYHDNFSGAGDFYIMLHQSGAPSPQIGLGPIGITLRDAGYGATATFLPATMQVGDWVRLRMELDLTANGGNGSADVYYQNLTDGDPGLVPIASLQNIDTNIVGAGSLPATWNTMRIDGRSGNSTTGGFDNFTVIVPEPGSTLLLLAGLGLAASRRARPRLRHAI